MLPYESCISSKDEYTDSDSSQSKQPLFSNYAFQLFGKFQTHRKKCVLDLKKEGSTIYPCNTHYQHIDAIIVGNLSQRTNKPSFIRQSESNNVQIVTESWLLDSLAKGRVERFEDYQISPNFWNSRKRKQPVCEFNAKLHPHKKSRLSGKGSIF